MKTTLTLADIKKLPPISDERLAEIEVFKNTDFSDCPPLTDAELKEMTPVNARHPEWYEPKKKDIHVKLDADVLEWFRSFGKGYQTRMNAALREYMLSH
ncbi:hypothetical protein FACS1894172_20020 [Spirochaetia bacterium]|nr:hypothetical protein FACS1894172_20020 [Spirochaetia bacterium]